MKDGFSETGIRRYRCRECGRRFTVITNTIFDSRKLPVSEWVCFLLDLFGYSSFSLTSKVNRNAVSTTKYWVRKLFLLYMEYRTASCLEERSGLTRHS